MHYPVINIRATGRNIDRLRREKHLSVQTLQRFFGFESPRAIYKWLRGEHLPSVDHLFALSRLIQVPIQDILIEQQPEDQTDPPIIPQHTRMKLLLQIASFHPKHWP